MFIGASRGRKIWNWLECWVRRWARGGLMGLRDKKRNQRRVLSRHSDGPKTGEEKDFPVACFPLNQIVEPENMATVLYSGTYPTASTRIRCKGKPCAFEDPEGPAQAQNLRHPLPTIRI